MNAPAAAHQNDADLRTRGLVPDLDATGTRLLMHSERKNGLNAAGLRRAVGMVDADPAAIDDLATEIGVGDECEPACGTQHPAHAAATVAAW